MRVLVWTLIWAGLLVAAVLHLRRRLRALWDRTRGLGDELDAAQERLDAVRVAAVDAAEGARLAATGPEAATRGELALFRSPLEVARERRAVRETLAKERDQRRAGRLPGWARRVDSTGADQRKA
jgi:hypothetical protein